jgi:hypothetical protein
VLSTHAAHIGSDIASLGSHNNETVIEQRKRHQALVSQITAKDAQQSNTMQANPDHVARKASVTATSTGKKPFLTPIFKWDHDQQSDLTIIPEEKNITFRSTYNTGSTSQHMLAILGYKIDLSTQVDQFKQKLQKFFIESKSHNPLVGKFSQLKFGITMAILGFLGVDPNTLETLKKEALKKAITDNIDCFEQNEYNIELLTIFSNKKKDKGRIKVLTALRNQLITQMSHYDNPDFYTKDTITFIKTTQIKKILLDLLQEHQNLEYIQGYQ